MPLPLIYHDYADLETGLTLRRLELCDEDRSSKESTVLLTGRGSIQTVAMNVAAVVYLTNIKNELHIDVYPNSGSAGGRGQGPSLAAPSGMEGV
ncbi:uncharacterized protein [Dermacentor albipictus]|uniref:uncharacterized protein n=1 Tax=Dermacentor albipictus TaxID=60249 RepID=UPI0038FCAA47